MKKLICLLSLLLFLGGWESRAQDSSSHNFTLAFGAGIYHSSHPTAVYYNGQSNNRLNGILQFRQSEIRDDLGGYNYTLFEYAQDMNYANAAYFELQLGYRFRELWQLNLNFMNVKLNANGVFTLRVERTNQGNPIDPVLKQIDIYGREKRSHLALGLQRIFPLHPLIYIPLELGYNLAFVEVQENKFSVEGSEYALQQNNDPRVQGQQLTTIGSSFYLSSGAGLNLPSEYRLLLQLKYGRGSINVADVEKSSGNLLTAALLFSKSF